MALKTVYFSLRLGLAVKRFVVRDDATQRATRPRPSRSRGVVPEDQRPAAIAPTLSPGKKRE